MIKMMPLAAQNHINMLNSDFTSEILGHYGRTTDPFFRAASLVYLNPEKDEEAQATAPADVKVVLRLFMQYLTNLELNYNQSAISLSNLSFITSSLEQNLQILKNIDSRQYAELKRISTTLNELKTITRTLPPASEKDEDENTAALRTEIKERFDTTRELINSRLEQSSRNTSELIREKTDRHTRINSVIRPAVTEKNSITVNALHQHRTEMMTLADRARTISASISYLSPVKKNTLFSMITGESLLTYAEVRKDSLKNPAAMEKIVMAIREARAKDSEEKSTAKGSRHGSGDDSVITLTRERELRELIRKIVLSNDSQMLSVIRSLVNTVAYESNPPAARAAVVSVDDTGRASKAESLERSVEEIISKQALPLIIPAAAREAEKNYYSFTRILSGIGQTGGSAVTGSEPVGRNTIGVINRNRISILDGRQRLVFQKNAGSPEMPAWTETAAVVNQAGNIILKKEYSESDNRSYTSNSSTVTSSSEKTANISNITESLASTIVSTAEKMVLANRVPVTPEQGTAANNTTLTENTVTVNQNRQTITYRQENTSGENTENLTVNNYYSYDNTSNTTEGSLKITNSQVELNYRTDRTDAEEKAGSASAGQKTPELELARGADEKVKTVEKELERVKETATTESEAVRREHSRVELEQDQLKKEQTTLERRIDELESISRRSELESNEVLNRNIFTTDSSFSSSVAGSRAGFTVLSRSANIIHAAGDKGRITVISETPVSNSTIRNITNLVVNELPGKPEYSIRNSTELKLYAPESSRQDQQKQAPKAPDIEMITEKTVKDINFITKKEAAHTSEQTRIVEQLEKKLAEQELMIRDIKELQKTTINTVSKSEVQRIKQEIVGSINREIRLERQRRGID